MATMLKVTERLLLLGMISFGSTLGNNVTLSLTPETGKVGEPLDLTCLLKPSPGSSINAVKWFLGNDTNGIQRSAKSCGLSGPAPSYVLSRYNFTCNISFNTFKLRILTLESSDDGQCWSCSVAFSNVAETDRASSACIKLQDIPTDNPSNKNLLVVAVVVPLLVIIFIVISILIFIRLKKERRMKDEKTPAADEHLEAMSRKPEEEDMDISMGKEASLLGSSKPT